MEKIISLSKKIRNYLIGFLFCEVIMRLLFIEKIKVIWQKIKVDTIAMLIFGIVSTIPTLLYEMLISGVDFNQWAGVRISYNILRFAGAYFLGHLIDRLRAKLDGGLIRKAFADAVSLSIYQIPIYILCSLIFKVAYQKIILVSSLYILDNFFFGWLYGYILDRTRKYFRYK